MAQPIQPTDPEPPKSMANPTAPFNYREAFYRGDSDPFNQVDAFNDYKKKPPSQPPSQPPSYFPYQGQTTKVKASPFDSDLPRKASTGSSKQLRSASFYSKDTEFWNGMDDDKPRSVTGVSTRS